MRNQLPNKNTTQDGAAPDVVAQFSGRRRHARSFGSHVPARQSGNGGRTQPPNIVYIVADDLGWADVGFHGSDIRRRTSTALAKGGAHARAILRPADVHADARRADDRALSAALRPADAASSPRAAPTALPTDEYLLAAVAEGCGLQTAMVGKWHLGHAKPEFWPRQRGFDYFYGALVGEIDHFNHESHGVPDWYRDNKPREGASTTTCSARRRRADRRAMMPQAAVPLSRLHRPAHALPGAAGISRPLSRHRGPEHAAPMRRCIGAWTTRSASVIAALDKKRHARQHADRVPQRQWRRAQRLFAGESEGRGDSAGRQRPVPRRQGHAL